MTIQNGNSWRAYFNVVEELFGDSVRPRFQIIRFLLPIVLAFGITWLFLRFVLQDLLQVHSVDGQEPSIVVLRWLGRLPTTPNFYYFIAALAGTYMGKRWCSYANLCAKFTARGQKHDECDLTSRDWWVVQELRKRAFFLRTRAVWILGGIFLLLVTGVYFTIFILPRVGGSDDSIRREITKSIQREVRQQQYKDEIGSILSSFSKGQYWIKVRGIPEGLRTAVDESRKDADNGKIDASISLDISVIKSEREKKENSTPEKLGVPLQSDEWITAAAFSANGRIGVVAGDDGSVFRTADGGENWGPLNVPLEGREQIITAAFSADGRIGVVAGDDGSVFRTADGGENWGPLNLPLKRREWITAAAFSADGGIGVVAGDDGSVFRTADGGENWDSLNLSLKRREQITVAAFSADGGIGVVAGDDGSVFRTADGGENWDSLDLSLKGRERIIAAAFGADGGIGVVAGDDGSVLQTVDGGVNWDSLNLPLEREEWITAAAFSADGGIGVVTGDEGSVFRTTDDGKSWESLDLSPLERGGWIVATAFGTDQIMIYHATSAVNLSIAGEKWKSFDASVEWRERITAVAFSADNRIGVVAGRKGSVFRTADGGESWDSIGLSLERGERITAAAFSANGEIGVVAGRKGSVFRTTDGGESWEPTEWDLTETEESIFPENIFALEKNDVSSDVTFVLEARDGVQYFLRNHEKLNNWRDMSLVEIYATMKDDDILKNAGIFQDIGQVLYESESVGAETAETAEDDKGLFGILDNLTTMRMLTLVSLLILVHILVRLHRYSVRLAAFWDARADAVLLAQSFARCKAETFDDLAAVFAPDAYDFKPAPRLGHESATKLLRQVLRGKSPPS